MTHQKIMHFEKKKSAKSMALDFLKYAGFMAGGIASFALIVSAPTLMHKDNSCFRNGRSEACSFDMKWTKSRLRCVMKDGKTVAMTVICTSGGANCVPETRVSGSSFQGKVRFDINSYKNMKGTWNVLLEEGPVRSQVDIPACKY